ncbi:MAG: hypothetical protein IT353_14560, partial [Gemmatimonadaceae bacterium]|nr:hypothetical protein [Gemmatimonadaceae bacterium]
EGVNTAAAYGAFAAARARATSAGRATHAHLYPDDAFASWPAIAALATNDFEVVVSTMHSGVATVLPTLRSLAARATARGAVAIGMMSGSGATCFLLASEQVEIPDLLGASVMDTETF